MSAIDPLERTYLAPANEEESLTGRSGLGRTTRGLPADLLADAAKRLQVLALLLAVTFALANFAPPVFGLLAGNPETLEPSRWLPGMVTIAISLAVYVVARRNVFAPKKLMDVGIAFGAFASFGIAAAEFWEIYSDIPYQRGGFFGLSWVAAWMMSYSVIIPNRPTKTLLSLLVSACSISTVFGLSMRFGGTQIELSTAKLFSGLLFPYLLVGGMALVGSRVVYRLGSQIRRAREVGSYRLTEVLGRGGMGEVWRAEHRMLARPAAIKLIRQEALGESSPMEGKTVRERFEREAQATASLRSPHTIDLYDFGAAEDGSFYYVMELLDGFDAESLIQKFGPLPAERAIYLLLQICESLGEAHAAGLVHRDIKPANLFVCRYGRAVDFIKVLDFGLVKPRDKEDATLTAENSIAGSPAFMSPEQITGNQEVDARSDVYAIGCVAYWLMTGGYVFEGETVMHVMMQHASEAPVPLSERTELPVPPELEALVMACLEKDPNQRPQSVDALADMLSAIPAEKPWTAELAQTWWHDHRPVVEA